MATDWRGVTKTDTFDKMNRLTGISYSGGGMCTPAVTYSYYNLAAGINSGISRVLISEKTRMAAL